MDVLSRCACGGAPALYAPDVKSETKYAASVVCHHCGVSMQMANHDSDPKRVVAAWNRAHPHRINTMTDLKNCPFCGSDNAMVIGPTCRPETPYNPADRLFPIVRCGSCCAEVSGDNEDYRGKSAIAAWNLRAASNDAEPVAWTSSGNLDGLRDHDSLVIGSMCNRQGDGWTVPLYLTAIEPVAASPGVPDGWRYSINYGPDGQEDWANLIAPDGRHVANIRTHHAIAIVAGMNSPSPAPIVPSTRWRTFAEEQPVAISYLARFFDNELGEWVFTTCDPGPLSITLAAPYTHWIPLNELLAPTSPAPSSAGGDNAAGPVEALLETAWQAILDAPALSAGATGNLPRLANCGRYLAEDNTGQWHYINHVGEWQACPPPSAGTGTSGWDWSVDAVDVLPFSLSDLERNATAQSVRYAIEILESNGYDILAPSAVRVPQWKQPAADDIDAAWLSLLEEDDRASPEEYPDHVLITKNKLHSIVSSFVAPASPEPSPSTEDVMGEARGALAIALSAIEKAGDVSAERTPDEFLEDLQIWMNQQTTVEGIDETWSELDVESTFARDPERMGKAIDMKIAAVQRVEQKAGGEVLNPGRTDEEQAAIDKQVDDLFPGARGA